MGLILAILLGLRATTANAVDSACDRAAYFLYHRHLDRTWLDSAQAIVTRVRQQQPGYETGLSLWARVLLQLGDDAVDRKVKRDWYAKAKAVADTLRRRNPRDPDGHMWWAAAQGRLGQLNGLLSSAGMVGSLRREFGRAVDLDSGYAFAWYALGRLHEELPSLWGGDVNRAEDYLRRGLAADSNYTIIRLELARVYLRQRRRAEARRELHALLATGQPTNPAEFVLDDRPAALELLKSLETGDR